MIGAPYYVICINVFLICLRALGSYLHYVTNYRMNSE